MEAEHRKLERLETKIDHLRKELEKLKSHREERSRQRQILLEVLKDQKQDVEDKVLRAQDVLTKTNHGMRHEYKEAMIQSASGVGTTNYILNVESQLCRALHGMYVLNRLYSARQNYHHDDKMALDRVLKLKREEGGINEFHTVKLLYQKEFEMQEFSDWIEEQCLLQCEMLSELKERLNQSHLSHDNVRLHLPTPRHTLLPAIDETTAYDATTGQEEVIVSSFDEQEEEVDDDEEDDGDDQQFDRNVVGKKASRIGGDSTKFERFDTCAGNASNSSLLSFFMQHSKLDFEQQQRWLEAGGDNDSESYHTLFIGDLHHHDTCYNHHHDQQPVMDDTNKVVDVERPSCQPVAQSA